MAKSLGNIFAKMKSDQIKNLPPNSPRVKSAVARREANSPENRAIRAATKVHKEGSFRWR